MIGLLTQQQLIKFLEKKFQVSLLRIYTKKFFRNKTKFTFILKVKKKSFMTRLKKRKIKNRYDNFSPSFYLRAQKAFLKIAKNKKNYFIIETSKILMMIEKKFIKLLQSKLGIKNEY